MRSPARASTRTLAPRAIRTGGRSMCGSPCAKQPPIVATLRTRTLDKTRKVEAITGSRRWTSREYSRVASGVKAPMRAPPAASKRMSEHPRTERRLTRRVGRNKPAFIIIISAVPPAIGRTEASSGSRSPTASRSDCASTSSKGIMIGAQTASVRTRHISGLRTASPFPLP